MNLPKIQDLYVTNYAEKDALMVLLNQEPHKSWVKTHPFIKGYKYLPIERVEFLLKKIFKTYKIEVLEKSMMLNAVTVTVRVHYLDPITGEMLFHDGVGAQEIQTTKGSGTLNLDMSNVNRGAVMMALPIAKTIAVKDACDHFGKLFGSDLNRKENINYSIDNKLTKFDKSHQDWSKVVAALKDGNITLEDVNNKYKIDSEIEKQLINETI